MNATAIRKSTVKKESAVTARRTGAEAGEAIESNPFYEVLFDEKLSAKQKADEFAKLMTFDGSKEQSRARVLELERFKEYLQNVRESMAKEIISLTDTDTFAELKDTYARMNQGLIDFEDNMRPLTEIIDAVYQLRKSGMTLDAFRAIMDDRKNEEDRRAQLSGIETAVLEKKTALTDIDYRISEARKKRGLFGFGGLTDDAKAVIAAEEASRAIRLEEITKLETEADALRGVAPPPSDEDPAFTEQKLKLRKRVQRGKLVQGDTEMEGADQN